MKYNTQYITVRAMCDSNVQGRCVTLSFFPGITTNKTSNRLTDSQPQQFHVTWTRFDEYMVHLYVTMCVQSFFISIQKEMKLTLNTTICWLSTWEKLVLLKAN